MIFDTSAVTSTPPVTPPATSIPLTEKVGAEDVIEHPEHYTYASVECIDVMLETQGRDAVMGFCICNAMKYIYRHKNKNGLEDIKKARWYLNKYIELAEK